MKMSEIENLDDDAGVVITGAALKALLAKSITLCSGYAPKGDMCFQWGKELRAIADSAEELE